MVLTSQPTFSLYSMSTWSSTLPTWYHMLNQALVLTLPQKRLLLILVGKESVHFWFAEIFNQRRSFGVWPPAESWLFNQARADLKHGWYRPLSVDDRGLILTIISKKHMHTDRNNGSGSVQHDLNAPLKGVETNQESNVCNLHLWMRTCLCGTWRNKLWIRIFWPIHNHIQNFFQVLIGFTRLTCF